ncbi:MAG: winged helix-turn-helix transcriptional regulator [Sporichthyaceae bacterium]
MDLESTSCAIERSLAVLGERWTMLILREASLGVTRFADFRDNLGVASDVLTDRLATLVEYGVLAKQPYREPGSRTRFEYRLTPAGEQLGVLLGALQQWGDEHLPWPAGPTVVRRHRRTDRPVHIGYLDDRGREVAPEDVSRVKTDAYPTERPAPARPRRG